jgi:lysophospholipase L1-like esterase
MRVLLILFCVFGMSSATLAQVTNQRLFDTVGFMVDHYAKRVALFQSEKIARGSVVFLGNSITEGGKWKELTGDRNAVNRGIGGDITFGVLNRLTEIIDAAPTKLFLLIGINDIGKDIPDAVIADNIRKIIERVRSGSPSTKLYIHSILPVNPTINKFPQHYDKNQHVKNANSLIQRMVMESNATFVDINKIFADEKGLLRPEYTPDGLHLNAQGYTLWVEYLKSVKAL